MKFYIMAITIGMVASFGTTSVSTNNKALAYQSLSVPEYKVSFERGSYEIIEAPYSSKTKLSDDELFAILREAGFSGNGLKMAKAIVFYESTNRPMALNKSSNCYGLFQINMSGSLGESRREKYNLSSNEDLFNPLTNAKIAYQMSNGGKNWSAWTTASAAKRLANN